MATEQDVKKDKDKEKSSANDKANDKAKDSPKGGKNPEDAGGAKELSTKKIIILMSLAFAVILIITVILLIVFLKPTAQPADASHPAANTTTTDTGTTAANTNPNIKNPAPIYQAQFIKIEPSFIVNFNNAQNIKFLEISVTLVTQTEMEASEVKNNIPFIKDQLVTLFSAQKYDDIHTQEGKELLRTQALSIVQQIMEKEVGQKCVSNILFTSFVMQ
jgi:flagellar FliL protein